jgi:predicted transcriptional regulator
MFTLQEETKYTKPRHSLVLLHALFCADRVGHTWTTKELAELVPYSRSTLYRAIHELRTHGFIAKRQRGLYWFNLLDEGFLYPIDMQACEGV